MTSDCSRAITVCFVVCAVWSVLGALCFTVHGLCFSRVSVDSPCFFKRVLVSLALVVCLCLCRLPIPRYSPACVDLAQRVLYVFQSRAPHSRKVSSRLSSLLSTGRLPRHHVHRVCCRLLLLAFALSTVSVVPYLV